MRIVGLCAFAVLLALPAAGADRAQRRGGGERHRPQTRTEERRERRPPAPHAVPRGSSPSWRSWGRDRWRENPNGSAWFPYRYPRRGLYFPNRYLFGRPFGPHFEIWYGQESTWFFWPFEDAPEAGCGWYWVPTRRTLADDVYGPRWRYWRWRYLYLCVD